MTRPRSGKRRLRDGVERVYNRHDTRAARQFGRFCREQFARFKKGVPVDARVLIRDAAAVNVDVVNLTADVDLERRRNRKTAERRARRALNAARKQLRLYLRAIDEKVAAETGDLWDVLRSLGERSSESATETPRGPDTWTVRK